MSITDDVIRPTNIMNILNNNKIYDNAIIPELVALMVYGFV